MAVPDKLALIVDLFATAPRDVKLQALLDYSRRLPPLPEELRDDERFERVAECQSPLFLRAELAEDGHVTLLFDAPAEAPTTRGFAGILSEGLAGANAAEILELPDDFYLRLGLEDVVSPLRMRGWGRWCSGSNASCVISWPAIKSELDSSSSPVEPRAKSS